MNVTSRSKWDGEPDCHIMMIQNSGVVVCCQVVVVRMLLLSAQFSTFHILQSKLLSLETDDIESANLHLNGKQLCRWFAFAQSNARLTWFTFLHICKKAPIFQVALKMSVFKLKGQGPCILSYKLLGDFIFIAFLHSVSRNIIPRFIDLLRH